MAQNGKRKITGFKKFGGKAVKYSLKALAKVPELAVRGTSKAVDALANSEQFQVVATAGGLVVATVACPTVALGIGAIAVGKLFADSVLNKTNSLGAKKGLLEEVNETLLLGNKLTTLACTKIISPAARFVDNKTKDLGKATQQKIDKTFDGR